VNSVQSKNGSVTRDVSKETNFTLAPKAGFFLNDEMAVGAGIAFETTRTTTPVNGNNGYETVKTKNLISFEPFFRYYALEFGPVSIFGEAYVSLGFGGNNTKMGSVTSNDESIFAFGA
jgi:outer membrane protein